MTATDGRDQAQQRYPSLAAFYNSDRRRVESPEIDVGLWWRSDLDGALHRAAWVRDTGELYLARLGPAAEGGGRVEVLALSDSREGLEDVLRGWREECGAPRSLAWLRERSARLRTRVGARRSPLIGAKGPGAMTA
jgi:hypothetical protein